MKKLLCLLAALLMLLSCAQAEEYVTLSELREQAAAGWNQTYEAMGREVVAKAEMDWFPEEAEACPLVSVDPLVIEEDDPRLDKWREMAHSTIHALPDRVVIQVMNHKKHRLVTNYRGKTLQDFFYYYDGETPDHAAEDCDVTYDEFLAMFESDLLELTGTSLEDIHIDEVWVKGPVYKAQKAGESLIRGDKIIATGCYHVFAHQLIQGIPVIGSLQAYDKGKISYHYYQPEYRYLTFWTVTNPAVIEEDLPLLSFDAFKGKLEQLMDAGKLRGVDAMRFGYGTCKDGDTWKLVPVWMVTCGYTDDPNSDKNVLPYTDSDGSVVWPIGYGEHYFNAQTGELMERYELNRYEDSLQMPKVLTWDDVN